MSCHDKVMILLKFITEHRVLSLLWKMMQYFQKVQKDLGEDLDIKEYRKVTLKNFRAQIE